MLLRVFFPQGDGAGPCVLPKQWFHAFAPPFTAPAPDIEKFEASDAKNSPPSTPDDPV